MSLFYHRALRKNIDITKIDVNARGNDVTNFWLNLGSMPALTYNKKQGVIITLGRKEFVREWKTAQN